MFRMKIWGEDFEQEVRPLIKSFYPGAEFAVEKVNRDSITGSTDTEEFSAALLKNLVDGETEVPDFAFLLDKTEGYMLVSHQGGFFAGEFHGVDPTAERRVYKDCLMRELYRILNEMTGIELPWGIMTGIRPTKQVLERLEAGEDRSEIERFMKEEYLCTDEKIETSFQVAETECRVLGSLPYENGYSLYIGIPFCPSTCYYCSFTSYPVKAYGKRMEEYLQCLFKEIEEMGPTFPNKELQSVYFGGGTPTTLSAEQLDRLFTAVEKNFDLSKCREITVEAGRPDSITEEKLRVIKAHGIERISINPQTMQQKTLDLIGRKHTVGEIEEAFQLARSVGFENINMDMILGLAGEKPEDVQSTLEQIGKLSPDNLTVHTLAVKRAARLNTNKADYEGMEAENVQEMLRLSCEFAKANDYHPYYLYRQKNMTENLENVGYSRPGKESLYNILIMEERHTILALGAGATTKFVFPGRERLERVENVKSLVDYIGRIDEMIARKKDFLKQYGDQL